MTRTVGSVRALSWTRLCGHSFSPTGLVSRLRGLPRTGVMLQLHGLPVPPAAGLPVLRWLMCRSATARQRRWGPRPSSCTCSTGAILWWLCQLLPRLTERQPPVHCVVSPPSTLCATTRVICCILENFQVGDYSADPEANGGVVVPEVLRPFMPERMCLPPAPLTPQSTVSLFPLWAPPRWLRRRLRPRPRPPQRPRARASSSIMTLLNTVRDTELAWPPDGVGPRSWNW